MELFNYTELLQHDAVQTSLSIIKACSVPVLQQMSLLLLRAQNCQHSSKAEHVTPETCVLHGIKVLSKALYSWEILFIINIYVTTPSRAKHMFTFLQSVFLRDSAGQMFLQEHCN